MKIKEFKNGAWTVFDKTETARLYIVKLYRANGDLADKVVCDDYKVAREYLKCFNAIASKIHK
jgi:hypothetical protein